MNDPILPSSGVRTFLALALLLPAAPGISVAQESAPAAPLPILADAATINIGELCEQLLASLRADLLARREKEDGSQAVIQLAQAIEAITLESNANSSGTEGWLAMQQEIASGRRGHSWLVTVQSYGSEKSMNLGTQLNQRLQREKVELAAKRKAEIEALGQKIAQQVFAAKSAAELDPLIDQISKYSPALRMQQMDLPADLLTKMQQLHQFVIGWQKHVALREAGEHLEAIQSLRSLRSERSVPWIPRSELVKQTEEAERLSGLPDAEGLSREVKQMVEQALAAEKGEAIDPLIVNARRLQTILQRADQGARSNNIQSLLTFLERWQKALIFQNAGNASGLKEQMGQLESYSLRNLDIPRSQLLQRIYAMESARVNPGAAKPAQQSSAAPMKLEPPEAVMERIRKLEDLSGNLDALSAAAELLSSPSNERQKWQQTVSELRNLERQYDELQKGLATRVNIRLSTTGSTNARVQDLQNQLSLHSLNRLLGEEAKIAPAADENPVTYLRRLLTAAREAKDWRLAQRVMEVAQSTGLQDPILRTADTTALTSFLTAQTQERARQFAFAAASYLGALKSGSDWVPVEEIGDRLAAIEKEHPADYAQGVEWARTPPQPNYPPGYYPPGYRPGYPPTNVRYPQDGSRPATEQPVVIPEKKSAPSTPASPKTDAPEPAKPSEPEKPVPAATAPAAKGPQAGNPAKPDATPVKEE